MLMIQRLLAVLLLAGTAILGVTAVLHPVLRGDGASHLAIIAGTAHWREIHVAMLVGTGLVITGIWVRIAVRPQGSNALLCGVLGVIALGIAFNGLNIGYMTGSGWSMAQRFAGGDASMTVLYDVTHPIGLVAARFGNILVTAGAVVLGWLEWQDQIAPRALAILAWTAAAGGVIAAFLHESTPLALGAIALIGGWQAVLGVWALRHHTYVAFSPTP